jgi:ADP-heptose:LPS heptosyltransferase
MHIASCFEIPTISVWGNTVPALGMYPYFPRIQNAYSIHEVENLKCRPCSKIGFQQCPKKHFSCMNNQNVGKILASIEEKMNA